MAEKGGKGGSILKGKGITNLSNGKPGRKKSQFSSSSSSSDSEYEASPSPPPKSGKSTSDWGKTGKTKPTTPTDKTGAKPDPPKPPPTPVFDIETDLPKNTKPLIDAEAKDILQKIQDHLITLSEDPSIKLPESFHKGLQYAKSSGAYTSSESARRVLELLKKHKVTDSEICLIGNICGDSADEVFALMPKLKEKRRKGERAIEDVLGDLVLLKSG